MGLKERIMKNKTKSAVCGAVVCALLVFASWQYGDKRCMSDDSLIYYERVNSRNFVLHANVGCSEARSVTGVWSKYGELLKIEWDEKLCTHCFWSWDIEKVLKRDYDGIVSNIRMLMASF